MTRGCAASERRIAARTEAGVRTEASLRGKAGGSRSADENEPDPDGGEEPRVVALLLIFGAYAAAQINTRSACPAGRLEREMTEPAVPPRSPVVTAVETHRPLVGEAADGSGTAAVGGSALKLAVVGPSRPDRGDAAGHTTALAHHLARAGHDVTLVSWSQPLPGRIFPRTRAVAGVLMTLQSPPVPAFPRTIRALSWSRPGSWVRTGRRLRHFDAIIVVHETPLLVPAHLAMLRAAGASAGSEHAARAGAPRSIVVAHDLLPQAPSPGDSSLTRSLFERVDAVMVHSAEHARRANDLHARRVCVADPVPVELPGQEEHAQSPDLSSPWAHYVGAVEALASPHWQAAEQDPPPRPTAASYRGRMVFPVQAMLQRRRRVLSMTRADLPEWVRPSDVLGDRADADDARAWARSCGLPRCADPIAAWAALGALAAIVRLSDDGHRRAVIFDGSGVRSPLSRWARAIGFAPVEVDLAGGQSPGAALDVDPATVDVITRLHPRGCESGDVDEVLSEASLALRSGGLISLTLPLGPATAAGAVGPADVRAILARAHALGFVLVGNPDGDITTLMRAARERERRTDAAYALVRLTFRRL